MELQDLILCMKISQQEWIEKLRDGEAWFGAIDGYIKKAEESNNNEQGDKYEGVFARCKKNSVIIQDSQQRFGDDLEIIDDGEYCFLRRKSSRLMLAFCMYGIKKNELELFGEIDCTNEIKTCEFKYNFEPKMYESFLQDGTLPSEVAGFYGSAGHIIDSIGEALIKNNYKWKIKIVNYDIDLTKEFYIEPQSDYPELWHKRKDLAYQHEIRFIIYNKLQNLKGVVINYSPISTSSANIAMGQLYFTGTAEVKEIND
ncbi:MAG: hypothetical protein IKJ59_15270 [Clostridia bacterium]|nr:hypothetical protein [Clostridia bacterium]